MNKNIFQSLKIIALALIFSIGISYVAAWTAPTQQPPQGNTSAPLNTSTNTQTKVGDLTVWGLVSNSLTANALKITGGTLGQVLTSDALGNATWQIASAATVSGGICGEARASCSGSSDPLEVSSCVDFTSDVSYYVYSARGCAKGRVDQAIDATELQWLKDHCFWDLAAGADQSQVLYGSLQMLCWN